MTKYRLCGKLDTTASGKLIYLMLLDLTQTCGNSNIEVPQRQISEAVGIGRSTVSRNLRRLKRIGTLDIMSQYNWYGGRALNKYVLK